MGHNVYARVVHEVLTWCCTICTVPAMNSHRDIIDLWPTRALFADEVGVDYWRACAWYRRNSIAVRCWSDVVRAAHERNHPEVTTDLLAFMKSSERAHVETAA